MKTESEISCGTVRRGESLMQFWKHRRTEYDGCQKGEISIALEHSKEKNVSQRLYF